MRILHVADRLPGRGGAHTWMLGILEGLASHHQQALVVGERAGEAGTLGLPASVCVRVRAGLESRTAAPVELDDVVAQFGPDVVHVHNVMNPVALEWAARLRSGLLTVQDHRYFCPTRGKWTAAGEVCRRAMSREACATCFENQSYFDEVLGLTERRLAAVRRLQVSVLSRYMREELAAVGVPAASVHVVPPFVQDLDRQARADGPPCVLFVGRLSEAKGVREALKAWRRSGVGLPLVVAGTGPLRAELEAEAAKAKGPPLEVLGWVGRERLSALYRRAAAVHPSLALAGAVRDRGARGAPLRRASGGVGVRRRGGVAPRPRTRALGRRRCSGARARQACRPGLAAPTALRPGRGDRAADGALRTGCRALNGTDNGQRKTDNEQTETGQRNGPTKQWTGFRGA